MAVFTVITVPVALLELTSGHAVIRARLPTAVQSRACNVGLMSSWSSEMREAT